MTRCLVSGHQIAWRSNAKDLWSPSQNIEGIKFTHWCALISTPQARIQWKVSCNDTSCRSHLLAHFTFPNKTIWIPTWRHTNSMKLIRQARLAKGTNIMGLYGFAKPKNTYQLIYSSSMFQPKPFPKSLRQFLFILGFSSKRSALGTPAICILIGFSRGLLHEPSHPIGESVLRCRWPSPRRHAEGNAWRCHGTWFCSLERLCASGCSKV